MATATLTLPSASPLAARCPGVTEESQGAELAQRFDRCYGRDQFDLLDRRYRSLAFTSDVLDRARANAERRVTR